MHIAELSRIRYLRFRVAGSLFVFLTIATCVIAEVPPLNESNLRSEAELILTGTVKSIEARDNSERDGIVDAHYKITVIVKATEKNKAGDPVEQVIVEGWQAKKRPTAWVGGTGHYTYPGFNHLSELKVGSEVRLFLRLKKEGSYEIIYPNGFEILKSEVKPQAARLR